MFTPDMEKDWMESRGIKVHEWTEQEKKWIEDRQKPYYAAACKNFGILKSLNLDHYDCQTCPYYDRPILRCPLFPDYKDAAEFEARVALLLSASLVSPKCGAITCCNERCEKLRATGKLDTHWCRLKAARIVIEQEMEKNKWIENSSPEI